MKRVFSAVTAVAFSFAVLSIGGCVGYYKVQQPSGGKTYYTTDVDETDSGAIIFQDDSSKAMVTLQNSEVYEINKDEYDAGIASSRTPAK